MNKRLGLLTGILVVILLLVCIRASWLLTVRSVEGEFALDYVTIFYEMKQKSMEGKLSHEDAAGYVESYYPVGTKLKPNSTMSKIVEKIRSEVLKDINSLRGINERVRARGAGRVKLPCDDPTADIGNVANETLFQYNRFAQLNHDYDDTSNVIETRQRRRHQDATGTGELTTPGGSNRKARVSYVAFYSDSTGRQIAIANYGTNDDTPLARSSTIPIRSDDCLVTTTEYSDDGEAYKTTDPADKEDRTEFDDAGRVTMQIENYTDGDPTTGGNDEDITVEFTYTADGQQATITAKQKSPSDDQTTKYIYGTSLSDSDISRTDLLRAVIYPDSDDTCSRGVPPVLGNGPDAIYDRVEHRYNRQGEVIETKDQNETVHAFDFDGLGRQTHDRVIALGANIDGAVRRISTTYEIRGQIEKITSYDNATVGSGSVVNEVLREYNDLGLLAKEYQEHDGAKDANTLYVGYNYNTSASGGEFTKGLRQTSIRYPDGRLVHYSFGSSGSDADNLNRLDAIKDDNSGSPGDTLASYTYLGLGQMVIEDYEEPEVKLDYFGGTSGTYAGFDRFNRIIDQRWHDYGASEDRDRFKYGYDRASNRAWKENIVSKNLGTPVYLDEFYTYDGANRLKSFDRAELNGTKTGITGTPARKEDWTLDPLGNWSNYIQKTDGTTDLEQDRTVNKANEITDITETTGTSWPTPSHDRAGNMTSIPQPSDLSHSYRLIWDGWNRLIKVEDGANTVAEYSYDGHFRRIIETIDATIRHFLHSSVSQVLEERVDTATNPDRQFVWGSQYIDDFILQERDATAPSKGNFDERIYTLHDANWNISGLIDPTGTVRERYIYAAYGTHSIYNAGWSAIRTSSQCENAYSFAGSRLDNDTSIYYKRTRYYHAQLGAFLRRDPIEYQDGLNRYAYARNNPVRFVDPSGLLATCEDFCGPDISAWLHQELVVIQKWVTALLPQIDKWAEAKGPWYMPDFIQEKAYHYAFLGLVAFGLRYHPDTKFYSKSCPTTKCGETVTLGSRCIHRSEVGNVVYGFTAAQFRMTWLQTWGGGIAGGRGRRTDADKAAIEVGFDFAHEHGGKSVSDYLTNEGADFLRRMASDAPADCELCDESVKAMANHIRLPKVTPKLGKQRFNMSLPDEVTD